MPLFAGSGSWRKFYLGLINSVRDTWARATVGGLGISTSGSSWKAIRGTWNSANGVATTADSPANNSIATVLMPSSSVTLTANNVTLGTGLSFWVKDSNNWTGAAGIESDTFYSYTYSCNCTPYTYTYSCGPCTPYTYCCSQTCSTSGPFQYNYTTYVYSCDHAMNFYNSFYGTVYSYTVTHYGCAVGATGNYYTYGCTCTGGTCNGTSCSTCSGTGQSCSTCNGTGTTVNYVLQLWQSVAGTVTMLTSSALSAILSSLRVVTGKGATPSISVTAYSDNTQTSSVGSISSSGTSSVTGNQHGILIVPSAQNQGNTIGTFSASTNG